MHRADVSAARPRWNRWDWSWLAGLTLLGFAVRLVVVTAIGPRGPVLNDSVFYLMSADALAHGQGYAVHDTTGALIPTAQWPPGYSALLSLVFRFTGLSEYAGQVLNAVLGGLTVLLLFLLVHRLFGRRPALVAAAAFAVMPGPVLWTDVVVAETLYTCVLTGVLLLFAVLPSRWWAPMLMGVAIGLATLIRGEGLLLIPAAAAWLWARRPRTGRAATRRLAALPRWAGSVALVVLLFALTLLPWGLRNNRAMGQFVPLSTNSSTTLWSGHNARATGAQTYAGPELLGGLAQTGKERELQEGAFLRREALRYLRSHPGAELRLIPLKLVNLVRGDGYVLDWVNSGPTADKPIPTKLDNPLRTVSDAAFFFVFGTALLAVGLGGRRLWRHPVMKAILALLVCCLVLFGWVYYGNYRYRTPLTPALLMLAAPLLASAWEARRRLVRAPGSGATDASRASELPSATARERAAEPVTTRV